MICLVEAFLSRTQNMFDKKNVAVFFWFFLGGGGGGVGEGAGVNTFMSTSL